MLSFVNYALKDTNYAKMMDLTIKTVSNRIGENGL